MNVKLTIGLSGLTLAVAIGLAGPAAVGSSATVAAVDGMAYVKTIKQPYVRFSTAFHVAVGPCYKKPNLRRCESANLASTAAGKAFAKALAKTVPPTSLATPHRLFVRGTGRYLAANRNQLRVLRSARKLTVEGYYPAVDDVNDALDAVNAAVPTARLPRF